MKLSVIMPVYNEKETIREILGKVRRVSLEKEVIIVDDASRDGITEALRAMEGSQSMNNRDIYLSFPEPSEGSRYQNDLELC